jgi:hypothetical protein
MTPCRHGDLGMQTATSIYAVSSRFGLGSDKGKIGCDLGEEIPADWRSENDAMRLPFGLVLIPAKKWPEIGRKMGMQKRRRFRV